VHDAAAVGVPEGIGDLARDADRVRDRQLTLALQAAAQRLASMYGIT